MALALVGRSFGSRPSALIKIRNDAAALDFDQAAANRLWWFDLAAEDRLAAKIARMIWSGLTADAERPGNQLVTVEDPAVGRSKVW